jgi:putative endonuclease
MSDASELGKKGEDFAADHLQKQGYSILARNFRFGKIAEIDIVAMKGKEIVFVEVKTRASNYLNKASIMVPRQKQRQIMKAASHFLTSKNIDLEWRFDIFSIVMGNQKTTFEHIEDAFYPLVR